MATVLDGEAMPAAAGDRECRAGKMRIDCDDRAPAFRRHIEGQGLAGQ
ncbi:hypothetical protein [Mesorhizobium sp.]|nr:hypothetical protein [Mesorhizobium sp.]